MDDMEQLIFQMISYVGAAKSKYIEALQEMKKGNLQNYEDFIMKGDDFLREGHQSHVYLIQNEAAGTSTPLSLLLVHAEDQYMSVETIKLFVQEMAELYNQQQQQ